MNVQKKQFLGISIAAVTIPEAIECASEGGLILAPSAPGLSDLATDRFYRDALKQADLNLPDSGLAILLMKLLGLGDLPRTSGYGFLKALLEDPQFKTEKSFWVMPSRESMQKNIRWMMAQGLPTDEADCYVAPLYPKCGEVEDRDLANLLMARNAKYVFICTGSGSQEKLGAWLKNLLPSGTTICCIGAAIGFLSGDQVFIPMWADRFMLGWFIRTINEPQKFIPRYFKALNLIRLAVRYRKKDPHSMP